MNWKQQTIHNDKISENPLHSMIKRRHRHHHRLLSKTNHKQTVHLLKPNSKQLIASPLIHTRCLISAEASAVILQTTEAPRGNTGLFVLVMEPADIGSSSLSSCGCCSFGSVLAGSRFVVGTCVAYALLDSRVPCLRFARPRARPMKGDCPSLFEIAVGLLWIVLW
ncbi:hypothetical protein Nepgr_014686 [Nepenthes gracilis]|uniref:Uncharacterized protein n=1 Tax=Nepenthes gracilis TaxID=150966 RepID=A0AAD3SJP9_NEPGR|nr:hypothetical protein Nepgr_014686 [Nepenthes gracilis]